MPQILAIGYVDRVGSGAAGGWPYQVHGRAQKRRGLRYPLGLRQARLDAQCPSVELWSSYRNAAGKPRRKLLDHENVQNPNWVKITQPFLVKELLLLKGVMISVTQGGEEQELKIVKRPLFSIV